MRGLLAGDERGGLRALGGLFFGVGAMLVLFRKTSFPDPWGDGATFAAFAIPCVLLYALGILGGRAAGVSHPWHAVFAVFGIVLIPWSLFSLIEWIGGDTDSSLNTAWVFLVAALAAFAAALVARVRVGGLLGALALIVAWVALWNELIDNGVAFDVGTLRGLLVIIALVLVAIAAALAMRGGLPEGAATDVGTGAALAAVAAGAISVAALPEPLLFFIPVPELNASANMFWDLYLFAVSLGAVVYGASSGARGTSYVGVLGLVAFIFVVGLDTGDETPEGSLLGWPLVLLVLGLAALAWSALPALRRDDS